jgi:hypothetical protein
MENVKSISLLKIRAGYGLTGSQAIQPYQSIPQYGVSNYLSGNTVIAGVAPQVMGNANLKWETTRQLSAGLDVQFVKRFEVSFDYYIKTIRDLLLPFQLPGSAGYASYTANRGSLENRGIELTLSGKVIQDRNLAWTTNLNVSRNRSKILNLGGLPYVPGPILDNNWVRENITGQFVGQPLSEFYGYQVSGLIQPKDFDQNGNPTFPLFNNIQTLGYWKFKDQNKDGVVNANDRVFLGDPNPKFYFGFNNDITYKNFSVNLFFQGSYGGKVFNATDIYIGGGYTAYNNFSADWYEHRWTPENPHNNIKYPSGSVWNYFKPTNINVEDGSYVRLKNLSVRYKIPLANNKDIQSIEVYVTGTNLLTWTKYSGMDPEVNLFGNRDDAIGVDFFQYPQSKVYTVGIRIGL